ncbi:MAG: putative Ig domain-containing protein [Pseudomonadota bacterium]
MNQPPTISGAIPAAVQEDEAFQFVPNASDPDGDALTFTGTNLPGWIAIDGNTGVLSGMPTNDDVGVFSELGITASDGEDTASIGPFDLEVVNVNDAPTISGAPPTALNEGEVYDFTPTAQDVDVGDTLTFSATNLPAWLTLDTATGRLSGTPGAGDVGPTGAIVVSVSDGQEQASLAAFTIVVADVVALKLLGQVDEPRLFGAVVDAEVDGVPVASASIDEVGKYALALPLAYGAIDTNALVVLRVTGQGSDTSLVLVSLMTGAGLLAEAAASDAFEGSALARRLRPTYLNTAMQLLIDDLVDGVPGNAEELNWAQEAVSEEAAWEVAAALKALVDNSPRGFPHQPALLSHRPIEDASSGVERLAELLVKGGFAKVSLEPGRGSAVPFTRGSSIAIHYLPTFARATADALSRIQDDREH